MKTLMLVLTGLTLLLPARPAAADEQQVLRLEFDSHDYSGLGRYEMSNFPGSSMVLVEQRASGGSYEVAVGATPPKQLTIEAYRLDNPPIKESHYAVTGLVGYRDVTAPAYLELWSEFPDGSRFFTRTLADSGPGMKIEGSSAPRAFRLEFDAGVKSVPKRLTLNIIMAGKGTITLQNAAITEQPSHDEVATYEAIGRAKSRERGVLSRRWATTVPATMSTADEVDQDLAARTLAELLDLRSMVGPALLQLRERNGDRDPITQFYTMLNDRLDRRIHALNGPPAKPSAEAASAFEQLPPEARQQMQQQIAQAVPQAMHDRDRAEAELADAQQRYAKDHPVVVEKQAKLQTANTRLTTLLNTANGLATQPTAPTPAAEPPLTGLVWLDRHFASVFLGLIAVCLAAAFPLQVLIRRGRGRGWVLAFFGLMLAVGLAELFAAGVAMGLGRPPAAWATLLGCAAIAIIVPALQLPQVRRAYADLELRKMRAMDVG